MTDSDPMTEPHHARGRLLRIFGLGFGLAVVIGGTIGSGILRNPSVVAAGFVDPNLIVLAWLAGGLFVAIDAMPTVELGAAIPLSGGPYSLAARAIGPFTGFFVGWADWLQLVMSTGFISVAFGQYVQRLGFFSEIPTGAVAIGLLLACGALNWIGARVGGASQNIGSALKALVLIALVATLFIAHGDPAAAAARRRHPPCSPGSRPRWPCAPFTAPMAAGRRRFISRKKCTSPSATSPAPLSPVSRW